MHGPSRLSSGGPGGGAAAAGRSSPPQSPRLGRLRPKYSTGVPHFHSFLERLLYSIMTRAFRRRGALLFAPLLYILGILFYAGSVGFDVVVVSSSSGRSKAKGLPQGSVYRSPQVFERLWPDMEADRNESGQLLMNVWESKLQQEWEPCLSLDSSQTEPRGRHTGYLIIEANGGLNQQRLSISDAVAVAELLNATLLIPIFHLNSVWRDTSKFGEIFDEEHFISSLSDRVNIVRELPDDLLRRFDYNMSTIPNMRAKAWSTPGYYLRKVLPVLLHLGAVRIAPFSNRLARAVPQRLQRARCLANFKALRFSHSIRRFADMIIDRMVRSSSHTGGKYVSVHLRFEQDMVAFSCCVYEGTKEEKVELDGVRETGWKGKFRKGGGRRRGMRPWVNRMNGKCPLTPVEVGIMLRGMGFDSDTPIYLAGGESYRPGAHMPPLRRMFPHLYTKSTLASPHELDPFVRHPSRMAAVDYSVCLHSHVFIPTQGGNFPHFLIGHRRYTRYGHPGTIHADKRRLARLLNNNITWSELKSHLRNMLRKSQSKAVQATLPPPDASPYSFPIPHCMCNTTVS